jgi:hypothetical protein
MGCTYSALGTLISRRSSRYSRCAMLFLFVAPHLHHQQEVEKYALEIYTALNAKLKDEEMRRTDKARLKFSFSSVR